MSPNYDNGQLHAHIYEKLKLRIYVTFNCKFGFENYLSIVNHFEQRICITKFRIFIENTYWKL
jgi:hypothetical protein